MSSDEHRLESHSPARALSGSGSGWLYRIVVQVPALEEAVRFYSGLLQISGEAASPGRHYFRSGGVILALYDPIADGDEGVQAAPNPDHLYFAFDDLEAAVARARTLGCQRLDDAIETRPWGERSIYGVDPAGQPFCLVDARTVFVGVSE